jgi:glyoxylase-like metal-dependent hydrolase (beta-lactamase superfamily II)
MFLLERAPEREPFSIFGAVPKIVKLTDRIHYLQMSNDPLSADVIAVRGDCAWWIFDVGACDEAVQFINELSRNLVDNSASLVKNVVISHFHRDHLLNVQRMCSGEISLDIDALYVGAYTSKTFGEIEGVAKNVVMEPLAFDDGVRIRILPMPNSHAKGSLALIVDDYVFLGDATYPMVGHGSPDVYNVQILGEQIKLLKKLSASRFCLSHKRGLVRDKTSVLMFLESVYARRQKNENYIVA